MLNQISGYCGLAISFCKYICVCVYIYITITCEVAQLCPTICNPMDCRPSGSSAHGDSPGKNTGVGCHALLQGIFSTQGSNPGFPHCRRILYQLNHQGSPILNNRQSNKEKNVTICVITPPWEKDIGP